MQKYFGSQEGGTMKKIILLFLAVCILGGCAAGKEQSSGSGLESSTVDSSANVEQNPELIRDIKEKALRWIEQAGYLLAFGIEDTEQHAYFARLTSLDSEFDQTIIFKIEDDEVFKFGLLLPDYSGQYGPDEYFSMDFSPEKKTAKATVEKTNCIFDFDTGTYDIDIQYRLQDLKPNYLFASNSDQTLELYCTNISQAGTWFNGDLVVLDTETKDIWYLGPLPPNFAKAIFCGNDAVLIGEFDKSELVDVKTGARLETTPQFSCYSQDTGELMRLTIGFAYDEEYKQILYAYHVDNISQYIDSEATAEIWIAVFDETGKEIESFNTGISTPLWYATFRRTIKIDLLGNRAANIISFEKSDPMQAHVEEYVLGEFSY